MARRAGGAEARRQATHIDTPPSGASSDRREFFRVTLDEVEAVANARGLTVQLTRVAEAQQWRLTMSMTKGKDSA